MTEPRPAVLGASDEVEMHCEHCGPLGPVANDLAVVTEACNRHWPTHLPRRAKVWAQAPA